ncbi:MAG: MFS transporter [Gemmatimonas sp.]
MTAAAASAQPTRGPVSPRVSWAAWAIGFFCDSYSELFNIIVPLWAIYLGFSPLQIGILVGTRSVLSFLLAIHGGALTDRFGTKRVLMVLAVVSTINPLLFPALSWFPFLILLQMLGGLAGSLAWVSAQALALQVSAADTIFVSRFAFAARVGTTLAPATIGFLWDRAGVWPSFIATSIWGGMFLAAALLIPAGAIVQETENGKPRRVTLKSLMPRLSDYVGAFSLLAIPSVVFVVAVSLVRICSTNIQSSFYIVYLEQISFPGTLIGSLLTIGAVSAGIGTLLAGPAERLMPPKWMYLGAVALSIVFICVTPLLGTWYPVLAVFIALRGFFQGLSGPIMFTYLSRSVKPTEQGLSIGLRSTANRVAAMAMPMIMGAAADIFSVAVSFYVMAFIFLAILGGVAVWVRGRAMS